MKNIYLIVGPSGVGKTTLAENLEKRYGYKALKSYTDRAPRNEDDNSHTFVSKEKFERLLNGNQLCEYVEFAGHHYAADRKQIDESDLSVVEPSGVREIKNHYNGDKGIFVIGLHQTPAELRRRMLERGDSKEEVALRVKEDKVVFDDLQDISDLYLLAEGEEQLTETVNSFIREHENRGGAAELKQSGVALKIKSLYDDTKAPLYDNVGTLILHAYIRDVRHKDGIDLMPHKTFPFGSGISFDVPEGYVGIVTGIKSQLNIANGLSFILPGNHKELELVLQNSSTSKITVHHGDKVASLLLLPCVNFQLLHQGGPDND